MLLFCTCSKLFTQDSTETNIDSLAHIKHHHPLPLEFAKVKAGYSTDSFVTNLYGEGYFDMEDGHGGSRYFTDAQKK